MVIRNIEFFDSPAQKNYFKLVAKKRHYENIILLQSALLAVEKGTIRRLCRKYAHSDPPPKVISIIERKRASVQMLKKAIRTDSDELATTLIDLHECVAH